MRYLESRHTFLRFDIKDHSGDVRDKKQLIKKIKGIDGVIHLAAISRPKWGFEDPYRCLETNIMGTVNVLEAVRTVAPHAWVVFASSREVFGGLKKLPADEESERLPLNAYGVSKVCGEDLMKQHASNYGIRALTVRFCGVYTGTNDILDRVIPRFILTAHKGKPLTVEDGGGKKKWDYVYIDDAVGAIEKAVQFISKKKTGFYDDITLSANAPMSLEELARRIVKLSNSKSKIIRVPARNYDQESFWGLNIKAKRLLGWQPSVSLDEGLRRSIKELSSRQKETTGE